ncbi:hypothetical protein CDEST_10948 [Colletotrichum destructivum]|uniref:Uncharacterized protein n=1 Tax=Colletotrichum destructivum TaxID=34406 RepID=A0AAX4IRU5_9PEZI|nr:hypothetical protein CDEST_10948 [Colletotrichum destructivum]
MRVFAIYKLACLLLTSQALALPVEHSLEKRAQNIIIGYRTVSETQAARYNRAGTLTDDGNLIGTQIGSGVYTTPMRGGWPGTSSSWYCVIMADSAAMDKVYKARIPQTFRDKNVWFRGDATVDAYIKLVAPSANPKKTIRISKISGNEDELQMVIPPGLLNSNRGGLGITASCKETIDELPAVIVDYDDWVKVFGSP